MNRPLFGLLFAALAAPASAQLAPGGQAESPLPDSGAQSGLAAQVTAWRAEHGGAWRARPDVETGFSELIFGGRKAAAFTPRTADDYGALALDHIGAARALHGLDLDTLRVDSVSILPLARGGSENKVAVRLTQSAGGVAVAYGSANVLMTNSGELLSIESKALPELSGFGVQPTRSAEQALERARAEFRFQTRREASEIGDAQLVIDQERTAAKTRRGALAWEFDLSHSSPTGVMAFRIAISADGTERVLRAENLVHQVDVGGQVLTKATPGSVPDTAGSPAVSVPAAYMTVTSPAGSTTTDANGFFNFPGVNGPLNVTFRYEGLYNDVENTAGANFSLTQSLSGVGNTVTMNNSPTEFVTSQSNVFVSLNTMRDWVRETNPSDGIMDFVNRSNTNLDFYDAGAFVINNCNALFNGNSTNYFEEAGGCVNTAYSTVVAHEQGHWLNVRYGSGNGSDGFGEGNADVFAMYLYDTPIVGDGFFGPGSNIRSGLNNLQFCGDSNPGCFGAVHTDGQVLMGAMWKMRSNLKAKHGTQAGGEIADALFLGWMNAYDQGTIRSVILEQMLTLDDDDGNIDNGTPNYTEINSAFVAQGFPGVELQLIELQNLIAAGDTLDEAGPYGIAIDAVALEAAGISNVQLFVENQFGFLPSLMTNVTGTTYTGFIDGAAAPAEVRYFIQATDTDGNTLRLPKGGPADPLTFQVGSKQLYFFDDFETAGDNGWTHQQLATQDDWQRGTPAGQGGTSSGVAWSDPDAAKSGTRAWGNDLGGSGFNGAYQPDVLNFLRSPAINLAGAGSATLRFNRWLTVEEGQFDQATIRVNNQTVWSNPNSGNLVDTDWTDFQLDISAFAGNPSVQVEFRLDTDGGLHLGGWNIDDVQVFSLDDVPTACQPSSYGAGLAGTGGLTPLLDSGGRAAEIGSTDFALEIKQGRPNSLAYFGYGPAQTSLPFLGGTLLVVPNIVVPVGLDVLGAATLPAPLPANPGLLGGSIFAQAFVVDPAAPLGFSATAGLQLTFCN